MEGDVNLSVHAAPLGDRLVSLVVLGGMDPGEGGGWGLWQLTGARLGWGGQMGGGEGEWKEASCSPRQYWV